MGVLVVDTDAEDAWIPPPPKKKWIRHYLSGEIPKDYTGFSSSGPPELSPLPPAAAAAPGGTPRNGLCPPISPPPSHLRPTLSPPPPLPPLPPPAPIAAPILHNHLQHRPVPPPPLSPPSPPLALAHHRPTPPSPPVDTNGQQQDDDCVQPLHHPLHQPHHQFPRVLPAPESPPAPLPPRVPPSFSPPPLKAAPAPAESTSPPNPPPASPPRAFRRITVSGQLARLEEAQELRRRVGSGTREVHNKLEKNRRAHLKECFELLKKQLPASQDEKKSSNLSILHSALRHIQALRRRERDCEHEMERLAREKIAAQQRLSALKKELSAQWDHIDFNLLLPQGPQGGPEEDEARPPASPPAVPLDEEAPNPATTILRPHTASDHYSNSTSTASERGHASDESEEAFGALRPRSAEGLPSLAPHPPRAHRRPLAAASPPSAPLDEAPRIPHTQESCSSPSIKATALVSPPGVHLVATPSSRQQQFTQAPGVVMAHSSGTATLVRHNSPPSGSLSPSLARGSPQPLALTVHAPQPLPNATSLPASASMHHHYHHSSRGLSIAHKSFNQDSKSPSSASVAATISVPTIHLAGKVAQHPVAFVGPVTSTAPRSPRDMVSSEEGSIVSPSPAKFPSSPTLHQHPTTAVAIAAAGGGIALPNGVVAHTPSHGAGVALARALSPASRTSVAAHCPTTLTLAHSPTSGITHLVTPLAGHATLVTTSGGAAGHPLMAPLALVSSTGGPVAAHILRAGSPGPMVGAASVGAKVMSSGGGGPIPLLKPLAVGGQLPLVNAQYLTTAAALGGLAHLVKPLVVVSSAPSAPPKHHPHQHQGGAKVPSSGRSDPSPPL